MTMRKPSSDTAHLYDGKVVRSSAPSRKKAAGQAGIGSEIPKDAIPELEMPSFIESLIGGPIVPKMKFLPPDKFVQNMQLGVYVILVGLALLTYIISPPEGTIWFMLLGSAEPRTVVPDWNYCGCDRSWFLGRLPARCAIYARIVCVVYSGYHALCFIEDKCEQSLRAGR